MLEIFATSDGATWTMAMSAPGGMSCVVAAGEHWQESEPPVSGDAT